MNIFQEENKMSDLKQCIAKRKEIDSEFSENFENGYQEFKIGEMLKMARKETGLTQEEVATAMQTKKSAISRIENHAQDIRLSTLQAFAHIMGKELKIQLV
jgi:DNA-binding XRE family transcriptional regulator